MTSLALCAALAVLRTAAATVPTPVTADPRQDFEKYKAKFGKSYGSEQEEERRYALFAAALERIAEGNKRNGAPVFGLNYMSDRTPEESYQRGRKGHGDTSFFNKAPVLNTTIVALPKDIDWRLTRAVTPVKNQGQCGSCWAFSTAEEVESQYALHVSDLYSETFSPGQINSCVETCDGCGGGDTPPAYEYIKNSPGLASSFFWPYAQGLTPLSECSDKQCTQSCKAHDLSELKTYEFYIGPYASVTGFSWATPPCDGACEHQDVEKLAAAVATAGPVSVCLNAGSWNDYTGGVLTAEGCGSMAAEAVDHCVQLVGYNTTSSTPYWIVRNSWAESFGEKGYIYLEYGKNTCGIADEATVAEVQGKGTPRAAARFARHYRRAVGGAGEEAGHPLVV